MKKKFSLGGSISALIGGVIAVLALVRGKWQIPLLLVVFAVWGLWIIFGLLLPSWDKNRMYLRKEQRAQKATEVAAAQISTENTEVMQALLCHVNYRISDSLKAAYPTARWEWTMPNPMRFVSQGGTGRIRVYNVPDYDFADVRLNQKGELSCSLVKIVPVDGQGTPPNQQPTDPQVWYDTQGRKVLEDLVADLNSRGHSGLTLKEDGSICIQTEAGGGDVPQDKFSSFPEKASWPQLAKVLEQEGLSATVQADCIAVAW